MSLYGDRRRAEAQEQLLKQLQFAIQLADPERPFTAQICNPLLAQEGVDKVVIVLSPNGTSYCFPVGGDIGEVQARINAALTTGGHAPIDWSSASTSDVEPTPEPNYALIEVLEGGYSALHEHVQGHEVSADVQARLVEPDSKSDPRGTEVVILLDLQRHVVRLPCREALLTLVMERVNAMLTMGGFPPINWAVLREAREKAAQCSAQTGGVSDGASEPSSHWLRSTCTTGRELPGSGVEVVDAHTTNLGDRAIIVTLLRVVLPGSLDHHLYHITLQNQTGEPDSAVVVAHDKIDAFLSGVSFASFGKLPYVGAIGFHRPA